MSRITTKALVYPHNSYFVNMELTKVYNKCMHSEAGPGTSGVLGDEGEGVTDWDVLPRLLHLGHG